MLTFTKMPGPHADTLPLIPTPLLIMAVNIGEAVGCLLPSKPPWYRVTSSVYNFSHHIVLTLVFLFIIETLNFVVTANVSNTFYVYIE